MAGFKSQFLFSALIQKKSTCNMKTRLDLCLLLRHSIHIEYLINGYEAKIAVIGLKTWRGG